MNLKRISARFVWLGSTWGCRLPDYTIVPGSVRPVKEGLVTPDGVVHEADPLDSDTRDLWCDVEVPVAWFLPDTDLLDANLLATLYPSFPSVREADYGPPTVP